MGRGRRRPASRGGGEIGEEEITFRSCYVMESVEYHNVIA